MFRSLTPRQLAFDGIVALLCVALRLGPFGTTGFAEAIMVLCMGAAFGLRRLSPGIALGAAWVGVAVQLAALLPPDLSNVAIFPVLYASAAYGTTRVKWLGLASAGGGALVATGYLTLSPMISTGSAAAFEMAGLPFALITVVVTLSGFLAVFGLSWTLGLLARTRATARESRAAQERAEQEERQARALAIVEQERNQIARDMHDVVAHSLAVVIAQADGARYAIAHDPDAASEALSTISGTAREALGDVRVLLTQLRHSQTEGPQPTLDDLDRLIDQLSSAGLMVRRSEDGHPVSLGTPQQLAVFRIVQEALTNVLRHGDTAREVRLHFSWTPDEVAIRIDSALRESNSSLQPEPMPMGHGLAGMRERAHLVGGTLTAEPQGDRFVVAASIPAHSNPDHSTQEGSNG